MKEKIIGYDSKQEIKTELVKSFDATERIIIKATVSSFISGAGYTKTTVAHASGNANELDEVEVKAINKAISLI